MIIISPRVCKLGKKINVKITMEGQRYMNKEKKWFACSYTNLLGADDY